MKQKIAFQVSLLNAPAPHTCNYLHAQRFIAFCTLACMVSSGRLFTIPYLKCAVYHVFTTGTCIALFLDMYKFISFQKERETVHNQFVKLVECGTHHSKEMVRRSIIAECLLSCSLIAIACKGGRFFASILVQEGFIREILSLGWRIVQRIKGNNSRSNTTTLTVVV
jgi:hypothetical protein